MIQLSIGLSFWLDKFVKPCLVFWSLQDKKLDFRSFMHRGDRLACFDVKTSIP